MNESWGRRVWRLLTPLIIYEGLCLVVQTAGSVAWAMKHINDFLGSDGTLDQQSLTNGLVSFTTRYAILMQGIGALVSMIFLYRMYTKDYLKRRFVFDRSGVPRGMWIFLVPAGIFACLAGSFFINIGTIAENSEAFMQSEQLLFSGPVAAQIVFIGFVIPLCEELIFRGLIYMRMRQYASVNAAIIISALFFAVMHGNMVQGIYAFILGVMLAYLYEKYGSLAAPSVVHISANVTSLVLSVNSSSFPTSTSVLATAGAVCTVITLLLILFIDRHVQAGRIYLDSVQEDSRDVSGTGRDGAQ